jgi:hypothetical protein
MEFSTTVMMCGSSYFGYGTLNLYATFASWRGTVACLFFIRNFGRRICAVKKTDLHVFLHISRFLYHRSARASRVQYTYTYAHLPFFLFFFLSFVSGRMSHVLTRTDVCPATRWTARRIDGSLFLIPVIFVSHNYIPLLLTRSLHETVCLKQFISTQALTKLTWQS